MIEWTHKQHAQFQQFDGVIRDKDEITQPLKQELANNQERHLQELDQALQDAERRAQQSTPVFAGTSTQPYATPVESGSCGSCRRNTSISFSRAFPWSISRQLKPEKQEQGQ